MHLEVYCLFQLVNSVGITFKKRVQLVEALNVNERGCNFKFMFIVLSSPPPKNIYRSPPPKNIYFSSEEYLLLFLLLRIPIALLRRISIAPPKNTYCSPPKNIYCALYFSFALPPPPKNSYSSHENFYCSSSS